MLMSVGKVQMAVINYVITTLDHMNVPAMLVIDWLLMASLAMVHTVYCLKFEKGKVTDSNNFCPLDVDECMEDSDRCAHNCQNTEGSYICNCSEGFHLDNDGYSCIGMFLLLLLNIGQKRYYPALHHCSH